MHFVQKIKLEQTLHFIDIAITKLKGLLEKCRHHDHVI
jgi:hypothetical protein